MLSNRAKRILTSIVMVFMLAVLATVVILLALGVFNKKTSNSLVLSNKNSQLQSNLRSMVIDNKPKSPYTVFII